MSMTVLMFGWEFPLHISGGLGTACYGLTRSLISENTNILFVVRKSHGDEAISMINASDVVLNRTKVKVVVHKSESRSTEVSSRIIPYSQPENRIDVDTHKIHHAINRFF